MTEFFKKISKTDTRTMLAVMAGLGVFSFVGLLFVIPVPEANVALLNTLLPMMVSSVLVLSYSFYFGSSKAGDKVDPKKGEEL